MLLAASCGTHDPQSAPPPVVTRDASLLHELAPCTNCVPTLVAKLPMVRAVGLALDDDGNAYVGELFGNHIFKVSTQPGSTPTMLYQSPSRATWGLIVHGDDVMWSSNDTGKIYAAPRSGAGPIRVVADNLTGIGCFHIDGDQLYWSDVMGASPGTMWKRPLQGGPSVGFATPAVRSDDFVFDGHDGKLLMVDDDASVLAISATGEVTTWFKSAGSPEWLGLAQDEGALYLTAKDGMVARVDRTTRDAQLLVNTPPKVAYSGIALTRDRVYFLNYGEPALLSVTR